MAGISDYLYSYDILTTPEIDTNWVI